MAKLHFKNKQARRIGLQIEPWACYDEIPPEGVVEIEFDDAPPPGLQFSMEEEGHALIFINSEHVIIRINGEERDFGAGKRFPMPPGVLW